MASTRHKELQLKFQELYKGQYNRVDPSSVKFLEFKTLHKSSSKDGTYYMRTQKPKDSILQSLYRQHVTLKYGLQILDLPKSPWGSHVSYNDYSNFTKEHFIEKQDSPSKDEKLSNYYRKLGRLKKLTNKSKMKHPGKGVFEVSRNHIFKTKSGNMYCRKHTTTVKLYEQVNERFKKIREFTFAKSEQANSAIERINSRNRNKTGVVNRLYTPSPNVTKKSYFDEKYRDLLSPQTREQSL